MAKFLLIETSTEVCSVSLAENDNVIFTEESHDHNSHTALLTMLIQSAMNKANWSFKELEAIAVSDGPGSYTSLRIGAATAKALCYAINCPLISVGSLTILSEGVSDSVLSEGDFIVPMIDARRMEVYLSVMNHQRERIMMDSAVILTDKTFSEFITTDNTIYLCGNGAQKYVDTFPHPSLQRMHTCTSSLFMASSTFQKFKNKDFEDVAYFNPEYLKGPNITISKKKLWD